MTHGNVMKALVVAGILLGLLVVLWKSKARPETVPEDEAVPTAGIPASREGASCAAPALDMWVSLDGQTLRCGDKIVPIEVLVSPFGEADIPLIVSVDVATPETPRGASVEDVEFIYNYIKKSGRVIKEGRAPDNSGWEAYVLIEGLAKHVYCCLCGYVTDTYGPATPPKRYIYGLEVKYPCYPPHTEQGAERIPQTQSSEVIPTTTVPTSWASP